VTSSVTSNDEVVDLDHSEHGPTDGEPVLVVSGLSAQRSWWPREFVDALAEDRRVLLPDNRDNGRSPRLDHLGGTGAQLQAYLSGDRSDPPPYPLRAVAADHVALLDRLGIERVHVVGASMGGMVAQHLAFGWPDRVRSLTAIMTTTGARAVSQPTPEAGAVLVTAPPLTSLEAYLSVAVEQSRVISSPEHFDPETARERLTAAYEVGIHPQGTLRQFLAILADGDRTERVRDISVPTLVVHGAQDPLIPAAGGRALADAVRGASHVEVEGMAHDLPLPVLDRVLQPLRAHLGRVEQAEGHD